MLGKSTLCSLLVRFYDPLNGQIKIDGKDIRTLNATWLRSNVIGMINQVGNCIDIRFIVRFTRNRLYFRPQLWKIFVLENRMQPIQK